MYDALTHDRVYRSALLEPKVVQMIAAERGKHFDPRLVDVFMSVLPEIREIAFAVPDEPTDIVDAFELEGALAAGASQPLSRI